MVGQSRLPNSHEVARWEICQVHTQMTPSPLSNILMNPGTMQIAIGMDGQKRMKHDGTLSTVYPGKSENLTLSCLTNTTDFKRTVSAQP